MVVILLSENLSSLCRILTTVASFSFFHHHRSKRLFTHLQHDIGFIVGWFVGWMVGWFGWIVLTMKDISVWQRPENCEIFPIEASPSLLQHCQIVKLSNLTPRFKPLSSSCSFIRQSLLILTLKISLWLRLREIFRPLGICNPIHLVHCYTLRQMINISSGWAINYNTPPLSAAFNIKL